MPLLRPCSRRQRKIRRAHPQRNLGQPGGRIYAECAGRRHAAAGRQSRQPPAAGHPARELNPADPLAQLAGDVDLRQLQQQQTDPAALFNTDTTFEREHILADTTPSALLAEQAAPARPATPAQNAQQPEQELDPLALFGGSSAPASPEALNSNDPLGLLMGGAVPLAQPEEPVQPPAPPSPPPIAAQPQAPRPQPTPPPVQTPEPHPNLRRSSASRNRLRSRRARARATAWASIRSPTNPLSGSTPPRRMATP